MPVKRAEELGTDIIEELEFHTHIWKSGRGNPEIMNLWKIKAKMVTWKKHIPGMIQTRVYIGASRPGAKARAKITKGQSKDKSKGKSKGQSKGQGQGKSEGKGQGKSEGQGKGKSMGKSKGQCKGAESDLGRGTSVRSLASFRNRVRVSSSRPQSRQEDRVPALHASSWGRLAAQPKTASKHYREGFERESSVNTLHVDSTVKQKRALSSGRWCKGQTQVQSKKRALSKGKGKVQSKGSVAAHLSTAPWKRQREQTAVAARARTSAKDRPITFWNYSSTQAKQIPPTIPSTSLVGMILLTCRVLTEL